MAIGKGNLEPTITITLSDNADTQCKVPSHEVSHFHCLGGTLACLSSISLKWIGSKSLILTARIGKSCPSLNWITRRS